MANLLAQRANSAFKKGDFPVAKILYQQAAEHYGKPLFEANLILCEQRRKSPGKAGSASVKKLYENLEVQKLNEEINNLKRQLKEKDANINERFKELAILTRMLEEKDASTAP